MFQSLLKFRVFLVRKDYARMLALLVIVVLMALLEVVGIASILPFLKIASDPNAIQDSEWLRWFYETCGFTSRHGMLIACGWSVIVFLTLSNVMAAVAVWQRERIAWSISHSVSMKLVRAYTGLPYEFFLTHDSSDLIKKIITDVNNLVSGVVLGGSQFLSQIIVASTIFALLLAFDAKVASCAFVFFAGSYSLIYFARRSYLARLGRDRLDANYTRYKSFSDLITGIKTILSDGSKGYFVDRFEDASRRFSDIHPKLHVTSAVPRYLVETLAFSGVVGIILYLVSSEQNLVKAIPTLSLFALAGYRLMPALNGAYMSIAKVLSNYSAIDSIYDDLFRESPRSFVESVPLSFDRSIELREICFQYERSDSLAINGISLEIAKGQRIAFVGPTGSGKTTLIDIITGLLSPTGGQLLVDGREIDGSTRENWQRKIGYVPQEVFLYDETIARNVAFGCETPCLDRIRTVCKIAQIDRFIESELTGGYETRIGERGVRLSGGQRQRLGLARALYRNPDILVLDEATSALDSSTEHDVVQAIHQQLPGVTIIMIAHRISTVRKCDRLYMIDRAQLVASGTYEELLESNKLFREIARFT